MPNANAPAGPGKPLHEREDAVAEQEGIAELDGDQPQANSDPAARHAERDAHASDDGAGGAGRRTGGRGR